MSKRVRRSPRRKGGAGKAPSRRQRVLPIVELLVGARDALHELVVDVGLQVLQVLLEEDREALCGPRSQPQPQRQAYRHGYDQGPLVLGGRKVSVRKPRARSVSGKEQVLPTWEQMSAEDPLSSRVLEQIVLGVSTRKYERSLEDLPAELSSVAVKKSSVSRRFVAKSREQVESFLSRPLEKLDLPVVMIDGKHLGNHLLLVALGIDADGHKHVLGVREGSTESFEVCRSFLRDLIGRGLVVERRRLFVIDGSRGLSKAIRTVFTSWAVIQRCQVHKMRNVLEHLPEERRAWVKAVLRRAYSSDTVDTARRLLRQLASSLQEEYPGAAASLEEGLEETLTLIKLGVRGTLYRSLRSTNPIENLHGRIEQIARNVKRWRSGFMAVRWAVTGLLEAEKTFRRVKGYRDLPTLLAALQAFAEENGLQTERKIA